MADTEPPMPAPFGLRLIADWFDAKFPGGPDLYQRELRRWADEFEELLAGQPQPGDVYEG